MSRLEQVTGGTFFERQCIYNLGHGVHAANLVYSGRCPTAEDSSKDEIGDTSSPALLFREHYFRASVTLYPSFASF